MSKNVMPTYLTYIIGFCLKQHLRSSISIVNGIAYCQKKERLYWNVRTWKSFI